jgi:hypothetical protein
VRCAAEQEWCDMIHWPKHSISAVATLLIAIVSTCGPPAVARPQSACARLLMDSAYLDEANAIKFGLQLIKLARASDDARVIAAVEKRITLAVVALTKFGVDSSWDNFDAVESALNDLSSYQIAAHGQADPDVAALLARLRKEHPAR